MPGATLSWSAGGLVALSPVLFVVWAVWSTGQVVHPIEVRLTLGPLACLSSSALGLMLGSLRLAAKPMPAESAALGIAIGFGVCEVLAFGYVVLAVALGIPAAP